jgi:hypothetical protein
LRLANDLYVADHPAVLGMHRVAQRLNRLVI